MKDKKQNLKVYINLSIAHELGHGAFGLLHTFNTYGHQPQLAERTTNNLMDYGDGTRLFKFQWDLVHSPVCYSETCGSAEDAAMISLPCLGWFDDCVDVLKTLENFRNARINGKNIKLKGQTKTDEQTLTGKLIKVGGTVYSKIRIIYKPENDDYTFDPLKYIDYNSTIGSDIQTGIAYLNNNKVFFKIIVDEPEKIWNLKEYLFGTAIDFEVESNNKKINENGYVTISAEPAMPVIKIKNTSASDVMFRLRIEYRRDIRTDDDYFPSGEWKTIKAGESWTVDFGDKIRGGKATLLYKTGEKEFSFVFHIRGLNPKEQDVKNYINEQGYDIWFLTRLIRQESSYHQFNEGTKYGPEWNDYQGCPNWGDPHGWGLMQLDKLNAEIGDHQASGGWRPSAQALWDWKENVRDGVEFLLTEKFKLVSSNLNSSITLQNEWYQKKPDDIIEGHADQDEGSTTHTIRYTHAKSIHFMQDFGCDLTDNKQSFIDASWIKSYNGSSGGTDAYPGYYYVLKQLVKEAKPYWDLHRTNSNNKNYVEFVSGREE